ncbi:eCIS core domain-containing protein [Streptomyces sp. NPDC000888]
MRSHLSAQPSPAHERTRRPQPPTRSALQDSADRNEAAREPARSQYSSAQAEVHSPAASPGPTTAPVTSAGSPLDGAVRGNLEAGFGTDLSSVRIHTDDQAQTQTRNLNARAFANGENLTFAAGRYAPERADGIRLLAHELAHVMQARAARESATRPRANPVPRASRAAAEAQADRMADLVLARVPISEAPLPVTGIRLNDAQPGEFTVEDEILAVLETPVGAEDRAAQQRRVARLTEIILKLPFWKASWLADRLEKPAPSDRLARAFHQRLSTATRNALLGRLRGQAGSSVGLTRVNDPRQDPKYIENVLDRVECMLIVADRYTLVWNGGREVVPNAQIDWTGTTKAVPLIDVHDTRSEAMAASVEWNDVAPMTGHDRAVAFYRSAAGVILPTWISPETAPDTYELIMGVNGKVREEAAAAADLFRGIRNGLIVGMVVGGVLRFAIRTPDGGTGGTVEPGGGGRPGPPPRGGTGGGKPRGTDPVPPKSPTRDVPEGGTPRGTEPPAPAPRMQEPIREMESGAPIAFGPRHAEALRQNAEAATTKWLKLLAEQNRVPWASIRNQLNLRRWRFLPQAPEAAAVLRNALSRLPAGPERTEMLALLERWLSGPLP